MESPLQWNCSLTKFKVTQMVSFLVGAVYVWFIRMESHDLYNVAWHNLVTDPNSSTTAL